ncbi:MAG: DUF4105 domain-containing protein [Gemmatimonadota bacterium]|nr:DUF4105 domain-containing protein [Gemmatimonadota bacterium]
MELLRRFGVAAALVLTSLSLPEKAVAQPAQSYRIALVTFEPGPAIYELFGHNGLWVRRTDDSVGILYDYGRFSFTDPGFLWRFFKGEMNYWMAGQQADREFERYLAAGRTIRIQELRLPSDKALALASFLATNVEPENRYYLYKYFTDNCSTRIRDALQRTVLPTLADLKVTPAPGQTYRSVVRYHTSVAPAWAILIELALGLNADHEISKWDETFIPERLSESIRLLKVSGPVINGAPAVTNEYLLRPTTGGVRRAERFDVGWVGLAAGSVIGLIIILANSMFQHFLGSVPARLWLVVTGSGGFVLLALWALTSHTYAASNMNILLLNPLALLAGLGTRETDNPRVIRWALSVVAGTVAFALILLVFPFTQATNLGVVLGVALPTLASISILQRRLYRVTAR